MGSDGAGNRKHFDSDLFNVLQVPGLPPSNISETATGDDAKPAQIASVALVQVQHGGIFTLAGLQRTLTPAWDVFVLPEEPQGLHGHTGTGSHPLLSCRCCTGRMQILPAKKGSNTCPERSISTSWLSGGENPSQQYISQCLESRAWMWQLGIIPAEVLHARRVRFLTVNGQCW